MTSRERVRQALNFQATDRPPIDLGSTRVSGVAAWSYPALRQALGLPSASSSEARVYDLSQFLAEVDRDVLEALGGDFVMLPLQTLPLELPRQGWKPFSFWDGRSYQVPEDFHPIREADGTLLCGHGYPWSKVERRMPPGCRYLERTLYPEISSADFTIPHQDLKDWRFPELFSEEFLRVEERNARDLFESTDKAVVSSGALGVPIGYGGIIGWAMKMRADPEHARDFLMREGEAHARRAVQYLQAVGRHIEVLVISTHDFGTQKGELFDPGLFTRFLVPSWKLVTRTIHNAFPQVKTFMHSCGSVRNLIPHFIEAGIDIYNPVQWSSQNMAREELAKEFGGRIIFWGGAAHNQRTLPFGTPEEVRQEVRGSIDQFTGGGTCGGYVVAPIHNIQADVPVQNILTLYEEARRMRPKAPPFPFPAPRQGV